MDETREPSSDEIVDRSSYAQADALSVLRGLTQEARAGRSRNVLSVLARRPSEVGPGFSSGTPVFVDYLGLLGEGFREDPLRSRERRDLLGRWERLASQLSTLKGKPDFRPGRRRTFDAAGDVSRRRSTLVSQLSVLDARLDEGYGPTPPLGAFLQALAGSVPPGDDSCGPVCEVVASTRVHRLLVDSSRTLRRSLGVRLTLLCDPVLAEDELLVVPLRETSPVPADPPGTVLLMDEAWAFAHSAHQGRRHYPRSTSVPVPAQTLSAGGHEVFTTLCGDGMDRREAFEAASRLAPS